MITIREAGLGDVYNLYMCNRIVLPIYYLMDEYLYFVMLASDKRTLVAEQNGNLCGYILAQQEDSFMHILSFGVYPEYRRQGAGTKLIDGLIEMVQTNPTINAISLNVHTNNHTAIAFYEKYGFKKTNKLLNYYNGCLKNETTQDAYRLEYMLKQNKQT
jgi:ribosomal protein S18 acetylase RimI-like enzyme